MVTWLLNKANDENTPWSVTELKEASPHGVRQVITWSSDCCGTDRKPTGTVHKQRQHHRAGAGYQVSKLIVK